VGERAGADLFQITGQPLRLALADILSDKFPLQGSGRITP
jgi:hypothetical protein